jgi:hypothetical protein
LESGKRAVELEPTNAILLANYGLYEFRFGDRRRAHSLFKRAFEADPDYQPTHGYSRVIAMAAYAEFAATGDGGEGVLEKLLEVKNHESAFGVGRHAVELAIKNVTERMKHTQGPAGTAGVLQD